MPKASTSERGLTGGGVSSFGCFQNRRLRCLAGRAAVRPLYSLSPSPGPNHFRFGVIRSGSGFGSEVRNAMEARIGHLAEEGLARRQLWRRTSAARFAESWGREELSTGHSAAGALASNLDATVPLASTE